MPSDATSGTENWSSSQSVPEPVVWNVQLGCEPEISFGGDHDKPPSSEELNQIEDIVYDSAQRDERRRLAPVRRTVVRLHRHLRTVLALMRRAAAADDDEMPFGFDDVARRLTSRLETVDHDIYALQDRARD